MRNLLKLLYAYHFLLLFIALEIICIILLFTYNNYHSAKFANSAQVASASIYKQVNNLKVYFSLKETNEKLAAEVASLRNMLAVNYTRFDTTGKMIKDTLYRQDYRYQEAKVVNNTVTKQYNYITIDKGSRHGIKPEMAVIGPNGIVGLVIGVSENYSTVMPVLNVEFSVSGKIKKSNYFGPISWDGVSSEVCQLKEISHHVALQKGDTIVTSQNTISFPEGILIGTIKDFSMKDGNFYHIDVQLSTQFRALMYVWVIENLNKKEQVELENKYKK